MRTTIPAAASTVRRTRAGHRIAVVCPFHFRALSAAPRAAAYGGLLPGTQTSHFFVVFYRTVHFTFSFKPVSNLRAFVSFFFFTQQCEKLTVLFFYTLRTNPRVSIVFRGAILASFPKPGAVYDALMSVRRRRLASARRTAQCTVDPRRKVFLGAAAAVGVFP